jgi:hypothetical protein
MRVADRNLRSESHGRDSFQLCIRLVVTCIGPS